MNNVTVLQTVIVLLVIGFSLCLWVGWRYSRRFTERTFMRGTALLAEECASLKVEVERAREVAADERSKRERYFAKISEFERERTDWQERYYAQSIGHGNAQDLMMSTIENLARQLQSLGHRPKIPSVLHALRSEYQASHEMPSRAAMEAIESAKALVTKPQPSIETHPVET